MSVHSHQKATYLTVESLKDDKELDEDGLAVDDRDVASRGAPTGTLRLLGRQREGEHCPYKLI